MLSINAMRGAISLLKNGMACGQLEACGLHPDDRDFITRGVPFTGMDQSKVVRIVEVVLWGIIQQLGLPKFKLSAEHLSAVICLLIHPCNILTVLSWFDGYQPNEALANPNGQTNSDRDWET